MNVVFVTPYFGKTGSEIALLNLVNTWDESDTVTVYSLKDSPELSRNLKPSANCLTPFKNNVEKKLVKYLFKIIKKSVASIHLKKIKRLNPDLIIFNTNVTVSLFDKLDIPQECKTIFYFHEMPSLFYKNNDSSLVKSLSVVDEIWCSSKQVLKWVSIFRKDNVFVKYPNIIFPKYTNLKVRSEFIKINGLSDYKVFGAVGGFDANKDPLMFKEILLELSKKHTNVAFVWIGAPKESFLVEYIFKCINSLPGNNKFICIERQNNERYHSLLSVFHGLIICSHSESLSMSAIEANFYGVPFFSFNNLGIQDVLHNNVNGRILDARSATGMAGLLSEYITGRLTFNKDQVQKTSLKFALI